MARIHLLQYPNLLDEPYYMKTKFTLHSPISLPEYDDNQISLYEIQRRDTRKTVYLFKNSKVNFERLPKPYDTDCQEYGTSNRFECLNQCIKKIYHDRFGCIPRDNSLYRFYLDEYVIFCNRTFLKNTTLDDEYCKKRCRTPCYENTFDVDIIKNQFFSIDQTIPTYISALKDNYYTKITYSASLTFLDLIINLTNIWSLWHGMSFISIFIELFELISKISSKITLHCGQKLIHIVEFFRTSSFHNNLKVFYYFIPLVPKWHLNLPLIP